jgi:hypothetical protein
MLFLVGLKCVKFNCPFEGLCPQKAFLKLGKLDAEFKQLCDCSLVVHLISVNGFVSNVFILLACTSLPAR